MQGTAQRILVMFLRIWNILSLLKSDCILRRRELTCHSSTWKRFLSVGQNTAVVVRRRQEWKGWGGMLAIGGSEWNAYYSILLISWHGAPASQSLERSRPNEAELAYALLSLLSTAAGYGWPVRSTEMEMEMAMEMETEKARPTSSFVYYGGKVLKVLMDRDTVCTGRIDANDTDDSVPRIFSCLV